MPTDPPPGASPEPALPAPPALPELPGPPGLPELREPDLPRTAKVRPTALRTGWTTGTCASAAARAAAQLLLTGDAPDWVEVALPSGRRVTFAVERAELLGPVDPTGWVGPAEPAERGAATGPRGAVAADRAARAVVVKDAGDDPDVTNGALLTATVCWRPTPGIALYGGEGVGVVTRPGLGLTVGGPAINPVPRRMITQAVAEVVGERGTQVVISVPDGERMARKTTNRRLGILGGISILGTTGIVRPFSTASWRASVIQAVRVAAAQGEPAIVLCTGGRTEQGAVALLPELPEVCFVEVGDFTGAALRTAVDHGMTRVVFVGMVGKLTKLAAGVLMTHYTRSAVDTGLLGRLTAQAGGAPALAERVDGANTARHAYELWAEAGLLPAAGDALCRRVRDVLVAFTGGALTADVAMVDFTGRTVVAATVAAWVTSC
ncbi:MAG TPA: cobalt-precorrin-5B (C(1))-methyltransferase [Catenuloplanes sp.]|jgi:cobalt-precorrin-5B (C1)-methyltransferase